MIFQRFYLVFEICIFKQQLAHLILTKVIYYQTRKKAREFPGFSSISQHCPSFLGISCAIPRFPGIFHAFPGFPMLSWDFQLSRDFPCLPGIFHAFLGFPMLSWDFPCFSRISHAFPEYSKFLEEYTPLRYYKVCSRKVAGERKT